MGFWIMLPAHLCSLAGTIAVSHREHVLEAPCRQPLQQPFSSTSIWNVPIGAGAILRPAHIYSIGSPKQTVIYHCDTEYMIGFNMVPISPPAKSVQTPVFDQGWWGGPPPAVNQACPVPSANNTWCHCVVVGNTSGRLPIPVDFVTSTSGNNEGVVLLNSTHVAQLQPVYRCTQGSPLLALWRPNTLNELDPDQRHVTPIRGEGAHG